MESISLVENKVSIGGYFDVDVAKFDSNGNVASVRREIEGGKNLITNSGMDAFGTVILSTIGGFLQVGTGSGAPANTDTALGARVAGVAAPAYTGAEWSWDGKKAVFTRVYTFAVGAATGVLSELGIAQTTSGTLMTRALFVDGGGSPVTVTVLADEQLIVTYRLVFEFSETDSTFVTTQKGTEYTLTLRPAALGVSFADVITSAGVISGAKITANTSLNAYSGGSSAIGSTTAEPSGTSNSSGNITTASYGTYVNGNYYRDDVINIATTVFNFASMGAFMVTRAFPVKVQIGITPRVTKTSSDTISFTIRTAWSRAA